MHSKSFYSQQCSQHSSAWALWTSSLCHHQLFVLSILTTAPLANLATLVPPPWNDIHVKHTCNSVPINAESLGNPPAATTIDLHIALKPHHESALIDALYEISSLRHQKYDALYNRSPRTHVVTYAGAPFRYGSHLSKEQVAELVTPHPETLVLVM